MMKKSLLLKICFAVVVCIMGMSLSSCGDKTTTPSKSSAKLITSFKFESVPATGVIDNTAKSVKVVVPSGVEKSALVPTIQISANALINPASGIPQDFSTPKVYTVTAEDGSQTQYTVTVTENNVNPGTDSTLTGKRLGNQTLKNRGDGIDYFVEGTFEVGEGLLTIEAGVKLVFLESGSRIFIGDDAGLKMAGTADKPIILTSPPNNNNRGAWGYIEVRSSRADNVWEYVQIINAGRTNSSAVFLGNGSQLTMKNCKISGSLGHGIDMSGTAKFLEFKNNTIENCVLSPMILSDIMQIAPIDGTSTFANNEEKFISIESASVDKNLTVNAIDVPYFVTQISVTKILTIMPGSKIDFESGGWMTIQDGATIIANGTPTNQIVFSGAQKSEGYWWGIELRSDLANSMKNCIIEYGGKDDGQNMKVGSNKISLTDCIFRNSANYGISITNNSKVTHSGVIFENCPGGNVFNDDDNTTSTTLP